MDWRVKNVTCQEFNPKFYLSGKISVGKDYSIQVFNMFLCKELKCNLAIQYVTFEFSWSVLSKKYNLDCRNESSNFCRALHIKMVSLSREILF